MAKRMMAMGESGSQKSMSSEQLAEFRQMLDQVEDSPDGYIDIVAQMLSYHIVSGKINPDTLDSVEKWAKKMALKIMEAMNDDSVVTHYHIVALIEALHEMGIAQVQYAFGCAAEDNLRELWV